MLDLSQIASQNFRFVSEDLEIKSNTPQVSQIQKKKYPQQQHRKVQLKGEAVEQEQTYKLCLFYFFFLTNTRTCILVSVTRAVEGQLMAFQANLTDVTAQ